MPLPCPYKTPKARKPRSFFPDRDRILNDVLADTNRQPTTTCQHKKTRLYETADIQNKHLTNIEGKYYCEDCGECVVTPEGKKHIMAPFFKNNGPLPFSGRVHVEVTQRAVDRIYQDKASAKEQIGGFLEGFLTGKVRKKTPVPALEETSDGHTS